MKTKVIVLGETEAVQPKKKIEFVKWLNSCLELEIDPSSYARDWYNIELISKDYKNTGLDLMFAYDDTRRGGTLYLGHFNDWVTE